MATEQRKISVYDLELGMFVSDLDRPWHETPFPIQGFLIKSFDDIDKLFEYCQHVYIDGTEQREAYEELVPAVAPEDAKKERLQLPPIVIKDPKEYPVQTTEANEVSTCRPVLDKAYEGLKSIYEATRLTPEHTEALEQTSQDLTQSVTRNPNALLWLSRIQSHNNHTYQHSLRMTVWALTLGRHLGLSEKQLYQLSTGCMLCQVGKLSLGKEVLEQEGQLDPLEFEVFKTYVNEGVAMLEADKLSRPVMDIVQNHQERHNGTGFPNAVPGVDIPLLAKIAGLAYYFELLITPAPKSGRAPKTPSDALNVLYQVSDVKFHSDLVLEFILAVGVYPVGSRVELSDGSIGVVVAHDPESRLRPKVKLVKDASGNLTPKGQLIDLTSHCDDSRRPLMIRRCLKDQDIKMSPAKQQSSA